MSIALLGCGLMGCAFARRLVACQVGPLLVWNRDASKARALADELGPAAVRVADSAEAAASGAALVVLFVASCPATGDLLAAIGPAALRGRDVLNMASGNPDQGRAVERLALEELGVGLFIDACYSGAPSKLQTGTGALMVSTRSGDPADVGAYVQLFAHLSAAWKYAGKTGASRALDYAVVDLFFANYVAFLSNLALMEREGANVEHFFELAQQRLSAMPATLHALHASGGERRVSGDYASARVVSLDTCAAFFRDRLPYMQQLGLDTAVPAFYASTFERAGAPQDDITRLGELLAPPSSGGK